MELTDMIMDSLIYPSNNLKAMVIYIFISIIIGIVAVATGVTTLFTGSIDLGAGIIVALIGIIVLFVLSFLIEGYALDIIKVAINRDDGAPELDFQRQISNGFKYFVVLLVYMLIPIIITALLAIIFQHWIVALVFIILAIIFAFALTMAECRLAQTDDLGYALDVKGSIDDLTAIGVSKVIITVVAIILVSTIVSAIITGIFSLIGSDIITSIVATIVEVYMLFFMNRAIGLLYSEK